MRGIVTLFVFCARTAPASAEVIASGDGGFIVEEIRFSGALGPLQQMGASGGLIWKLSAANGGTQVEWTYAVSGFRPGGLGALAPAVDGVLAVQLQRLKRFVETGRAE